MPMASNDVPRPHCDVRPKTVPVLSPDLAPDRLRAIRVIRSKWVNGTVLHYHFLEGPESQRQAVRNAFKEWKDLAIGLEFVEVADRSESEVRIAFDQSDGSWSYVGRDVLGISVGEPTMNFGWDLTDDYGRTTALHEIGHTLGLPHEHQNPFAGIVWDEPKVYSYFAGQPNVWSRQQTFHNVLRKLDPAEVEGSEWDPDSVMEYWFPAGLIKQPEEYRDGLNPPGGLSEVDKEWARKWFPPLAPTIPALQPFQSVPLSLSPGQQADFTIEPPASRRYRLATFGTADTVLVLFEEVEGQLRYLRGDDDSGVDRNAHITVKLFQGRRYVARVRLYWAGESGQTALMYW
jgi:Astacin (Peptidase family M12A)